MTSEEVKSHAASGAVLMMGRGAAVHAIGLLGNLALARLLVPDDFGIVAIGLTVVGAGQLLASAGLGAALVASSEVPEKAVLRALVGLQLVATSTVAAASAMIAIAVGGAALVTALMVVALPLTAFRTPAMLLLQRRLEFGAQVKVEVSETLIYVAVSITLAALGLGAWSLAIATVLRVLTGTVVAIAVSGEGFIVPSGQLGRLRPILSFGWRFQATGLTRLVQEAALTAGIAAIAGLSVLGIWTFASRILAIPRLLADSIWRVGFPTFSRLKDSEEEEGVGLLLDRIVGTFAVANTLLLCPLVASSPALVPLLFGSAWTDVSLILPGAGLAMAVGGPLGMVTASYLYARGDASTGLVGSNITGITRLAATMALLPGVGVSAIGIGWAIGTLAGTAYTMPRARRKSGARLVHPVAGPTVSAAAGALVGWLVAEALGVTLLSALLSSLSALAVWGLAVVVLARTTLVEALGMGRSIFGSAFGRARTAWRRAPVAVPTSGG